MILGQGNIFSNRTQQKLTIKGTNDKLIFLKMRYLCLSRKWTGKLPTGKKYLHNILNIISAKNWLPSYIKILQKSIRKRQTAQNTWTSISQKIIEWPKAHAKKCLSGIYVTLHFLKPGYSWLVWPLHCWCCVGWRLRILVSTPGCE